MAWQLKGKVAKCEHREYGFAQIHVKKLGNGADVLFEGLGDELEVRDGVALQSRVDLPRKFSGLDVPRGSTIRNPSGLPRHRAYIHCPVRSHRPQRQAMVWCPIPP
jgi:hypothetical protein